jgi:signal peptidase II
MPEAVTGIDGTGGPLSGRWVRWLALSALVIVLDQWTKAAMIALLPVGGLMRLTDWFDLVLAYNHGAAFSVLADNVQLARYLFSAVAVIASVLLLGLIRSQQGHWPAQLGGALILGGALGNLVDRVRLGAVVDFIQWHVGSHYWPAFNVADSAISVGAAVLVLHSLRSSGASR